MKDKIENFCAYYDAFVGPGRRVYRRPKVSKIPWDPKSTSLNSYSSLEYENVPMVQIEMPEDRFNHLIEMRDRWDSNVRSSFHLDDMSRILWKQHEKESRLRHQHLALKDLWERYQAMLALVDDGR